MSTTIEHHHERLDGVELHYAAIGDGEPVVLVHGWPSTWYEWRHVMPLLAAHHRVIAPDLRGLGDSSRPTEGYDKKTLAADLWQLLGERLALRPWHLVGHDWGGPVAFALAAAHPEAIATLSIVDVTLPGIGPDISQGGKRWHHAFHMTPDLPEALVRGRERAYLGWFYEAFSWRRGAFAPADLDEYLRTYTEPGALEAGFALYRNIPRDASDNRALVDAGLRLTMPVLAVGGGRAEARGRGSEPEQSLALVADDVIGAVVPDCGHFVPEERPAELAALLMTHFRKA
ncbi:MAG TPA: alpha/beta fold hydrolase [Caldimonas sp.]|jgi:pimeloyl-ACP methyl ester carboxylesterase|nr:alpha/beta fold hydrolase [Caldimonas sp.]HEX2542080.1 alpha/beta fold hydrolase [Caldimonas sp.]